MRTMIGSLFLTCALLTSAATAQKPSQQDLDLQAAIRTETIDGDLNRAIQEYQRILTTRPLDHSVAAKALLHIGECYEKLGQSEAHSAYERLLRDYSDQRAQANEARLHLAGLGHNDAHEMVMRRLWSGPTPSSDWSHDGAPTPDGKYLTYLNGETQDLAVRDLASGADRRLQHATYDTVVSVPSPDSKQVAYSSWSKGHSELHVIGIDGSDERTVYSDESMLYADPQAWTPDGKKILATLGAKGSSNWQIALVSVSDGSLQVLKEFQHGNSRDGGQAFVHGCISPDGRFIAYSVPKAGDETKSEIHLLSADGKQDVPVVTDAGSNYFLGWAPDGTTMVFASNRTGSFGAWAVPVIDGKAQGAPRLLRPDIGAIRPLGFTKSGEFYYAREDTVRDLLTAKLDFPSGKMLTPSTPVTLDSVGPAGAFSSDGNYVAYRATRHHPRTGLAVGGIADTIVIRSLKTGTERELAIRTDEGAELAWSPDGHSLVLYDNGISLASPETGGVSLLLANDPKHKHSLQFLPPDQKSLVYAKQADPSGTLIILRDLKSGNEKVLVDSKQGLWGIAVSPDGRSIAFATAAYTWAAAELKIMTLGGGEPRTLYSAAKSDDFHWGGINWTPDGKWITFGVVHQGKNYISGNTPLWEISPDGGKPQMLAIKGDDIGRLQILADNQTVAYTVGDETEEVGVIENLLTTVTASR